MCVCGGGGGGGGGGLGVCDPRCIARVIIVTDDPVVIVFIGSVYM